jgi:hypothetical protein
MIDNRGKIWLAEELQQLRSEFATGATLEEMMVSHGRTAYAIIGKLEAMGHLTLVGLRGYHRIDPDPWVLVSVVRQINEQNK